MLIKNLDGVKYYALYCPRQDRYVRYCQHKPMLVKRRAVAERHLREMKIRHPSWDLRIHSFTLSLDVDQPLPDDPT